MTQATPLYRAVVLEIERLRIAAGWPSWQLDDHAGAQDGFWQKALHPDTASGRQARWETLQLYLDALVPDGFDVEIKRKNGASLDATRHPSKIRHIRAQYHKKTQRDIMRELSQKGSAKGGIARAKNQGKRKLSAIGKMGARARWEAVRRRGQEIAAKIEKGSRGSKQWPS